MPHELDGTADLVYTGRGSLIWCRTSTPGPRWSPGSWRPGGRFVLFEGHPVEWLFDVDEDGTGSPPTTTTSAGAEASQGWAPEYIDRLSIPEPTEPQVRPRWTLGEVITALLGADLRLERVTEHPVDWCWGHLDARPEERGRIPLSYSMVGRKGA